jgi:hypothetical protein
VTLWAPLAAAMVALAATGVRAQALVEEVPEDACDRARSLDAADASPVAQHLRRSCRLERFGNRLAAERRQEIVADEQLRQADVGEWLEATQPARVTRPMSIEGFVGEGLANYGLSYAWDFLRRGELGAWIGWRPVSCQDQNGNETADCGRTAFGLRGRWYLNDRDFSPFLGTGFAIMSSHLQAISATPSPNGSNLLVGSGRANSVSAEAGFQLGIRAFRMSIEYIFEYAFYTGANLDDAQKTPSEDLRVALRDSLKSDRNGIRFQVGYGF